MKKAYYKIKSYTLNSSDGKIKRVPREMWVEVNVTDHKSGKCNITPVRGYGSLSVKSDNLKLI